MAMKVRRGPNLMRSAMLPVMIAAVMTAKVLCELSPTDVRLRVAQRHDSRRLTWNVM